jgi:hypothetical protein
VNPKVGEDGRYEVVRTLGEGEERRLPDFRRKLVLRRDRYECVFCGEGGRLEVDHIIPWSAGGSDDMDNLRTLCHRCNQERSNFKVIDDGFRRLPTAHECVYCTPHLLGEPDVVSVYCMPCNKKAPGVPLRAQPDPDPTPRLPDEFWEVEDDARQELDIVAAKYRAAALATIRAALAPPSRFRAGRLVVHGEAS